MAAITDKCDFETQSLTVFDGGNGGIEFPSVESKQPVRIGPMTTPFMLHVLTDNPDLPCPTLDIQRVVECPKGCEFSEYKWSFPCECTANYLLPAGTYDITVCKQYAYPLRVGETLGVTFLVEPVTDSFAAIYSAKSK